MNSQFAKICAVVIFTSNAVYPVGAQQAALILDRDGSTIVLQPYAQNIIRVTLSTIRDSAVAAPGYGFVATPSGQDWVHERKDEDDVYRSPRLIVSVAVNKPQPRSSTQADISKYFHGASPPAHITISTPNGKTLLQMTNWWMSVPNYKDDNAGILHNKRPAITESRFEGAGPTAGSNSGENHRSPASRQVRRIEDFERPDRNTVAIIFAARSVCRVRASTLQVSSQPRRVFLPATFFLCPRRPTVTRTCEVK